MSYTPYLNQEYEKIKHDLLKSGKLFEDDKFPPKISSISKTKKGQNSKDYIIQWKRPHEISKNPQFIVDGVNPNDLNQGDSTDCWLISAIASVAAKPEYANRVIPQNQSFNKSEYAGIFHFRFWQFGEWVDVVVDDFIPTVLNSENNQYDIIYCSNKTDKNEFFGPLIEKAYAKLFGCYDYLNGGQAITAMTDLTGSICENFNIKKCVEYTKSQAKTEITSDIENLIDSVSDLASKIFNEKKENKDFEKEKEKTVDSIKNAAHEFVNEIFDGKNKSETDPKEMKEEEGGDLPSVVTDLESLWKYMLRLTKINALMNASSGSLSLEDGKETQVDNGLLEGHAYSVLQAVEFETKPKSKKIRLVKLRNPHGLGVGDGVIPWKGEWANGSKSWKDLDKLLKEKHQLNLDDHGEFYMSYEDFYNFFVDLHVANTQVDSLFNLDEKISSASEDWKESKFYGEYKAGSITPETLDKLQQYLITCDKKTHIIISVMRPLNPNLVIEELKNESIGFYFGKVTCNKNILEHKVSEGIKFSDEEYVSVEGAGGELGSREFTQRINLEKGYYIFSPVYDLSDATKSLKYLARVCYDSNSTRVMLLPKTK